MNSFTQGSQTQTASGAPGGGEILSLRSREWHHTYSTSTLKPDGKPTDVLHEFYVPVLSLSTRCDRVAGYFRSSSLAAASQGFSAFVGHEGQMRMIVGADMDPDDVSAIIDGDEERLAQRLGNELEGREGWPEEVRNGVDLLAWMVAHGHLEVRVGFRLHGETREPLPVDSTQDGYVHEKWAIFADRDGNRIHIGGSLNESRTALVLNAENISVHCDWWGDRDRSRVDYAQATFDTLWVNANPHMPVLTLPDAVQRKLVRMGKRVKGPREIDGTPMQIKERTPEPSAMERLRFAMIKEGPRLPGGKYVGMETAPVEPWPHQWIVARRLIDTWPCGHMLCDEVGLGKTIEAALAIRSLVLSGLARRVLIAPPASLVPQWHRELASKFFLRFAATSTVGGLHHTYLHPVEEKHRSSGLCDPDLVIISTGLLPRRERLREIHRSEPFDIALIDEAHYARRSNSRDGTRSEPRYVQLYTAIRDTLRNKARSLLLATATPMQLDQIEVWDLLHLFDRVGAFQSDPTLTQDYYGILGRLNRGETPLDSDWEFIRRAVRALQAEDPLLWRFIENAVIDGRIRPTVRQWLDTGRRPRGSDLRNTLRLMFSGAPLSRVMMRHGRDLLQIYREHGQLEANLATRHVQPIPQITMNGLERSAYSELETYCNELTRRIQANSPQRQVRFHLAFMLSFLRLRLASSLFAIRETLRRRREKVVAALRHMGVVEETDQPDFEDLMGEVESETDEEVVEAFLTNRSESDLRWEEQALGQMLTTLGDISGPSSKMTELLRVLDRRRVPNSDRIEQTVIFTRFFDTLTDIVARLRQVHPHMLIGTFSGQGGQYTDPRTHGLRGVDREQVKHRFLRGEIDVLVCTDAAAEGLNLQTADLLVNFDLPWNPMKVEQRCGRIDRIGQRHENVYILNLCYVDSAEQIVYGRLLQRLREAENIVGPQQFSLLPVLPNEFQELAEGRLLASELERRALDRLRLQRRQAEAMQIPPDALYEIYGRLAERPDGLPCPVTLDAIWEALTRSDYLRELGCVVGPNPDTPLLTLNGIQGVEEGGILTPSRRVFEEGLPEVEHRLGFATYGDQRFDTLMLEMTRFDLPPCVRQLSVPIPSTSAEMVGYAALCDTGGDTPELRLLTCLGDLSGVSLSERSQLTDAQAAEMASRLCAIARREHEPIEAARNLERANQQAAMAQEILSLLVGIALMRARAPHARDGDKFWPLLKDIEEILEDREEMTLHGIPIASLRAASRQPLFDVRVPATGQDGSITAPQVLLHSAVDQACRAAESLRTARADLETEEVLQRLQRSVTEVLRRFQSA